MRSEARTGTRSEVKKIPVYAGMKFSNGKTVNNKLHKVGYKLVKFTYNVYSDGDNSQLIKEETVKTVITA